MSVLPSGPASGAPKIVSAAEAPARLAVLGLTEETFQRGIQVGDSARRRVSGRRYPRNYPGIAMWAETLGEIRRLLIKQRQGWRSGMTGNYETVFSAEREIAIAVVGGDKFTGFEGERDPKLSRRRGPMTTRRIDRNRVFGQMELGLDLGIPLAELPPDEACKTWFLLVRPTEDEVRIELSLPLQLGDDGLVDAWAERILLNPVAATGAVAPIPADDDDEDDDDDLVTR